MATTDSQKINQVLTRGVEEIIEQDKLKAKLESGRELRIKLGIDPTSPNIHLGRAIPLLKLRDFQELGHKIVLIIGDFTGVIGDTSDKESERPMLTPEQIEENMRSYVEQAGKILQLDKCEVHHNSEWLGKLDYHEIGKQANVFSLSDFISRENIKKRLDAGKRISLRELLYPLMQGYDSVAVKADVEVGGTDQRFNLLAGRELQRHYNQEPQDIITGPLIEGLDGRKMSSSWGNVINLFDDANEMYGKVMSVHDDLIIKYFTLLTRVDLATLPRDGNPKDLKMKLAYEIVRAYHSDNEAKEAENYFINTFGKKEIPTDLTELKPTSYDIVTVLVEAGFSESKSEAKQTIEQGGVKVNGEVVSDFQKQVVPGDVIQKGKRFFVKIK